MSDKSIERSVAPATPEEMIPEVSIATDELVHEQLSVPKTIILPSTQIPAESPKPTQTPTEAPQSKPADK